MAGGRALLFMSICAALTGLMEKAHFIGLKHQTEARVLNFTALAILLFGVFVDMTVVLGRCVYLQSSHSLIFHYYMIHSCVILTFFFFSLLEWILGFCVCERDSKIIYEFYSNSNFVFVFFVISKYHSVVQISLKLSFQMSLKLSFYVDYCLNFLNDKTIFQKIYIYGFFFCLFNGY